MNDLDAVVATTHRHAKARFKLLLRGLNLTQDRRLPKIEEIRLPSRDFTQTLVEPQPVELPKPKPRVRRYQAARFEGLGKLSKMGDEITRNAREPEDSIEYARNRSGSSRVLRERRALPSEQVMNERTRNRRGKGRFF